MSSCKHCRRIALHKHYEKNAERIKERMRLYCQQHGEENRERARQWNAQNPERERETKRLYRRENREKIREYAREYKRQPKQRLRGSIGGGMWKSLKFGKSGLSWESLVGYTADELRAHLESQFKDGMTWDNYGNKWQIDHIRPISDFDFTSANDPEFRECWSLWNLQPLFAEENMSKGSTCEEPPLPLLTKGEI